MDLWSKKGLKYSIEHAQAKLAMLGGAATREEEERQVEDDDFFLLRILKILQNSLCLFQWCLSFDLI